MAHTSGVKPRITAKGSMVSQQIRLWTKCLSELGTSAVTRDRVKHIFPISMATVAVVTSNTYDEVLLQRTRHSVEIAGSLLGSGGEVRTACCSLGTGLRWR